MRSGHGAIVGSGLVAFLLLARFWVVESFMCVPTEPQRVLKHTSSLICLSKGSGQTTAVLRMSIREETAFPVISRIAGGVWEGEMRYAGAELQAAPFVLSGSTSCVIEGACCTMESSVTFPNGKTRTVTMRGEQTGERGSSFRLDPLDEAGPIYMRLAELAPDTVLLQEYNKTDERVVLTASISIVQGGNELIQIAHEMADKLGAPVKGYQIWRMQRRR